MSYRMTNEQMREAIARAVGWKNVSGYWVADGYVVSGHNAQGKRRFIPNYPADLNAIREAVCALPQDLQHKFSYVFEEMIDQHSMLVHEPNAADWCRIFCRNHPCGCGCGLTIWECSEAKAKEGAK